MKKLVAVLFGGKSAEHEVSLKSAKNVIQMIDRDHYDVVAIGIDKEGKWFLGDEARLLIDEENPDLAKLNRAGSDLVVQPGSPESALAPIEGGALSRPIDVVFPVLHGPYGEDGAVQGMLKLAGLPHVGAGVLGAAVGMDKDVMKRLLCAAGIANARFRTIRSHQRGDIDFDELAAELGTPMFIKPANLGSSVGIHKVRTAEEFSAGLDDAFSWDRKVIVEELITGREVECSILGNENPRASVVGEIVTQGDHDFYSYDAKYIDESGAALNIPADLEPEIAERVRTLSIEVYEVLECAGLARVDSFVTPAGEIFVNEINTLPGFTNISMYTKLWEATGMSQTDLIAELLRLAIERHANESKLRTSR
jgi:D-alanine-D-alanine ligase